MAPASEATSSYFAANLGNLDQVIIERLQKWAAASAAEHAIRRHADGSVTLYASRAAAKTARQYQSLLRTLSSHWKMPFGKLDSGWLSLLTEHEYRAVVGATNERRESEVAVHSQCQDQARLNAPQSQAEPAASCMYPLSLTDGFDERAQVLYDSLRANGALQPHTVACAA